MTWFRWHGRAYGLSLIALAFAMLSILLAAALESRGELSPEFVELVVGLGWVFVVVAGGGHATNAAEGIQGRLKRTNGGDHADGDEGPRPTD